MTSDKGAWAANLQSGQIVRGCFTLLGGRHPRLMDASGIIPMDMKMTTIIREGPVHVTGEVVDASHRLCIRPVSLIPLSGWTGNPFALPPEPLPNHGVAMALYRHLKDIPDDETRALLVSLFGDPPFLRRFLNAPASIRHHHAWPGGLALHTVEVMDTISRLADRLDSTSRALLLAAGMLHDAGKAFEYAGARLSQRGRMVGHDISLIEMLTPTLDRFWPFGHPKRLLLMHLLTARPAPAWTGIRQPRTELCSLLRFADRWSIERDGARRVAPIASSGPAPQCSSQLSGGKRFRP